MSADGVILAGLWTEDREELDVRDVGVDRRVFLAQLGAAGVASVVGCAAGLRPTMTAPELEASGDRSAVEILGEPIALHSGESLVDRSFVLSEEFRSSASNAIIVVQGDGVTIRGVRLLGSDHWDPHWDDFSREARAQPGVSGKTVGIRIENVRDITVEQVSIEGLPRAGISGFGIEEGLFRDITIRHCFSGINLLHNAPSRGLRLERIHTGNMWSQVDAKRPGDMSLERPGGWIGGDGLALNSLRDSTLVDCTAVGEMFGAFKLTNPQRVRIQGLRGTGLMVQGTAGTVDRQWSIHKEPAREVVLEDCVFDKGLGHSASLFNGNCLQLSQNIASVSVERCLLNGAGKNGHAIQMSRNVHGRVTGCTVRGFNGVRGQNPAHAIDLAWGSTVNTDFEQVNRFVDQKRIRLDRNPR